MADVFITDIEQTSKIDDSFEFVGDNGAKTYSIPASVLKKYTNKGLVNPNLIDNWHFVSPVNQRGLTEYSGLGYGIDRWKSTLNPSKYALGEKGIIVFSGNFRHLQILENATDLVGRKLTVSFLISENTATANFAVGQYVDGTQGATILTVSNKATGCVSGTFTASEGFEGIYLYNTSAFDGTAVITAVKLELGDIQTLAHQDTEGNWVLNEIPNYAEELAKCQRYFQIFRTETERKTYCEDFRPTMRVTDNGEVAKSTLTIDGVTYYAATADL